MRYYSEVALNHQETPEAAFPLRSKLQRVILEYQDVFDVKVRLQATTGVSNHFAELKPGAAGQGLLYEVET
jgi:hypothetical protein